MSILIKNARAVVTVDSEDRVLTGQNILIKGHEIVYIGKEEYPADETIDASDYFVYPGLINTHHHLYQTFTRNLPQVQNMELFDWLITLYEIWKGLTPDMIYYSSLTGMADLMKNGCTTCFDHHYVFPHNISSEFIDVQFRAADDLGIRCHSSRGSMSRSKKDGGLPPDSVVQTTDEILNDSLRLIEKYHDPKPFSMRQIVLAPCSPFSVTPDLMVESAKLARAKHVRLHTHLAETLDEERFTLDTVGMRPLAFMESLGWVGPDVWFAHGIHFNDDELKLLAQTHTSVAHCPISNMKLSSGVARVSEMLQLGVHVGLGVDGSASNDGSNLLEEMRVGYLLQRLKYSGKAASGYDMLKLATVGSASVLGRTDIGSLEVGKAADLFMVDMSQIDCIGTSFDPKSMLATVGLKRPVDYTIVNGNVTVRNGRLVNLDEQEIAQKANALVNKLNA
jgi:cytosine/adenosine deaminase-related metal-dependent hydrolase